MVRDIINRFRELTKSNSPIVYGIKFIPFICTALMVVHTGLLVLDKYEPVTITIAAILMVVFLVLLSIRFNFCRLHKAMILYIGVMILCVCVQSLDGFGVVLTIARMLMFGFGMGLMMSAFLNKTDNGNCDK